MLHKKGGLRWQKRWFVLTQSGTNPARLAYFRERNDSNGPRATLELSSKTKIDLLPGTTHGFQVIMQGRALKVYAESADDRESWMRALRDAIAIAISQTLVHAFGQDWFIDPKCVRASKGSFVQACEQPFLWARRCHPEPCAAHSHPALLWLHTFARCLADLPTAFSEQEIVVAHDA